MPTPLYHVFIHIPQMKHSSLPPFALSLSYLFLPFMSAGFPSYQVLPLSPLIKDTSALEVHMKSYLNETRVVQMSRDSSAADQYSHIFALNAKTLCC